MKLNENYARLNESYLFAGRAAKVREYKAAHPKADVVSLGIGDVTRPLTPAVICELQAAAHVHFVCCALVHIKIIKYLCAGKSFRSARLSGIRP